MDHLVSQRFIDKPGSEVLSLKSQDRNFGLKDVNKILQTLSVLEGFPTRKMDIFASHPSLHTKEFCCSKCLFIMADDEPSLVVMSPV